MHYRAAFITLAAAVAWATAAGAAVEHAGEWQSIIGNGQPLTFCIPADRVVDQAYVSKSMARMPNAACTVSNFTSLGPITSYSLQCTIGGSVMTSSGTVTQTGPDSFTSKSHSHGGAIKMGNGQTMVMPDMDMTVSSHRVGPCKPGDRVNPY